MGFQFTPLSFLFLLLATIIVTNEGARDTPVENHMKDTIHGAHPDQSKQINSILRLHSMDNDVKEDGVLPVKEMAKEHVHVHAHSSSHMDHMDTLVMVFFTLDDLKVGKELPINFPRKDPSSTPKFLPREEANSIPFSNQHLPHLLRHFSFYPGSPQAIAMGETLTQCENKPIKGETKTCATSLESMLDFVRKTFGMETKFQVLNTNHHFTVSSSSPRITFQNYTIMNFPKEVPSPRLVACHTLPYPYAIFYCHSQETENKVFLVPLRGKNNGEEVEALAVCHLDTSRWNSDHVAFKVLGTKPGSSNVCHFFPEDNLVYVPRGY